MSQTLTEIAQQLNTPKVVKKTVTKETKQISPKEVEENKPVPKVQLIYAFNGTGKTRLSREFKALIAPKNDDDEGSDEVDQLELSRNKILYYNAFTEDLFYWDNDAEPKLKIQPNSFTDWILKEQGQDQNIIANFQRYANDKLTPRFNEEYQTKDNDEKELTVKEFSEVTFSLERGDDEYSGNLKISKGEESNFIWSIFYTLLDQVITTLNVAEPSERESNLFDQLEYVFIDDPVSSLDENHLIELAIDLAQLIRSSNFTNGTGLKFIVSTHNPLFYNVLYKEVKAKHGYILKRFEDGTFELEDKKGDSNKSFSYHLYIKRLIEQAIENNGVQRYHFTLLRNLYEKAANFLGYPQWSDLLPENKQSYSRLVMNFYSHRTLSNEEVAEPTTPEKKTVKLLLDHLKNEHGFWQEEEKDG